MGETRGRKNERLERLERTRETRNPAAAETEENPARPDVHAFGLGWE